MIRSVRNEIHSPRKGIGWSAIAYAGGTASLLTNQEDADLGECFGAEITGANFVLATSKVIPCKQGQVIKASAKIKITTDYSVSVRYRFVDRFASPVSTTRDIANWGGAANSVVSLEGFDTAPRNAALAVLDIFTLANNPHILYITDAMVTVDPWGDPGIYSLVDDWQFEGTEDESAQNGTFDDTAPPLFGYNNNVQQHIDPEITSEEECRILKQCGGEVLRFALTLTLDGFWSGEGDGNPDPTDAWPDESGWEATRWPDHLRAIRAAGLKAMPIVWQATPTLTGSGIALKDLPNETARQNLAELYAELFEEFSDIIVAVELHNEPNLGLFWNFGSTTEEVPNGAEYYSLWESFRPIIENVLSDEALLLAGALNHHRITSDHDRSYESFVQQMYDGGFNSEGENVAISCHPYPVVGDIFQTPLYPGPRSGDWIPQNAGSDGFWGVINKIKAVSDSNSDLGRSIWITEYGMGKRILKEDRWQAQLISLTRGMAKRREDIGGFIAHALTREGPTDIASYFVWAPTGHPYQAAELLAS